MENIIQRQMGRSVQREFVSDLVQTCQEANIDPENLEDLLEISRRTGFKELHITMMGFFKSRLKMQEQPNVIYIYEAYQDIVFNISVVSAGYYKEVTS